MSFQEADNIRSDMDAAHQHQFDEMLNIHKEQLQQEQSAIRVRYSFSLMSSLHATCSFILRIYVCTDRNTCPELKLVCVNARSSTTMFLLYICFQIYISIQFIKSVEPFL